MRPGALGLTLALVAAAACSESAAPDAAGPPAKIEIASASMFTAAAGTALDAPLVARVRDERDRPVPGAVVRFTVEQGLATLSAAVATTDAEGRAQTRLTLGTVAGDIAVRASVPAVDVAVQFTGVITPTAPSRLAIQPKPVRLFAVGDTARLFAGLEDRFGNQLPSAGVQWRSLDETLATVDAHGLVTGRRTGASTRVIGSVGSGHADTVTVSVADPSASVCAGPAVVLAQGQAVTMDLSRGTCLRADAMSDYVVIPFYSTSVPGGNLDGFRVVASGVGTAPSASVASADVPVSSGTAMSQLPALPVLHEGFERSLREREAREVVPLVPRERAARAARAASGVALSMIPKTLSVGDLVTLNASAVNACTTADTRVGRVAAVSQHAVVVADTANPADGFTQDDYRRLGQVFDTLVVPEDERLFGRPGDMDGNGRSVIFYTRAVNQLTTPGSGSYVGGFFWSRDLIGKSQCPTSNEGELFYMLVPDPQGVNGNRFSKAFVEQVTVGTLAHEYQHLINASRRYANPAADPSEVVWLNEGLSHIAEEMLLYRTTGLSPRGNIGGERFGTGGFDAAFGSFQYPNFARLRNWLLQPESNTAYGNNDVLATRGAAWAFLRYLADRRGTADGDAWFRLVNSPQTGMANVEQAFGVNGLAMVRDWAIAMFVDDFAPGAAPEHTFPSWNLRSAFPSLPLSTNLRGAYPLAARPLLLDPARPTEGSRSFQLRGGGAAYMTFTVAAGKEAQVRVTTATGLTPPPALQVTVVRIR